MVPSGVGSVRVPKGFAHDDQGDPPATISVGTPRKPRRSSGEVSPDGTPRLHPEQEDTPSKPVGTNWCQSQHPQKPSEFGRMFMQACNTDPSTGFDDPENRLRGATFSAWLSSETNSY